MSKIRKYCTNLVEPGLASILKTQGASEAAEVHLSDKSKGVWYMSLYQAEPEWSEYTRAVGAVTFVPKTADVKIVSFDLFYYIDDILDFWNKHKKDFDSIELLAEQFPKLHECAKDRRIDGSNIIDEYHPSEWAEVYASPLRS